MRNDGNAMPRNFSCCFSRNRPTTMKLRWQTDESIICVSRRSIVFSFDVFTSVRLRRKTYFQFTCRQTSVIIISLAMECANELHSNTQATVDSNCHCPEHRSPVPTCKLTSSGNICLFQSADYYFFLPEKNVVRLCWRLMCN